MEYPPVYDRLVQAARARELVHYGELTKMLGIDMDDPYFGARVGWADRQSKDSSPA